MQTCQLLLLRWVLTISQPPEALNVKNSAALKALTPVNHAAKTQERCAQLSTGRTSGLTASWLCKACVLRLALGRASGMTILTALCAKSYVKRKITPCDT